MSRPSVLYARDLPGGGFVAIDCLSRPGTHHARLWVERRGDPGRRSGHIPPVIAEVSGADMHDTVAPLAQIAADNVALAQAIRRWQLRRRGDVQ